MVEIPLVGTAYEHHMLVYRAAARCDFDVPESELFVETTRGIKKGPVTFRLPIEAGQEVIG